MTTLMIKTHNTTGLKYFCKSTKKGKALESYTGSGKYWKRHLKVHGKDITSELYAEFEDNDPLLVETALQFSKDNNIVESEEWANIKPENGLDGAPKGCTHSEEAKQKMSKAHKGKTLSEEHKRKIGLNTVLTHTGMKRSDEAKKNMSEAQSKPRPWMKGTKHSEERRKKNSESQLAQNRKWSEEAKRKMSEDRKGKIPYVSKEQREEMNKRMSATMKAKPKVKCPFCDKEGSISNMKRWHFENCKLKD